MTENVASIYLLSRDNRLLLIWHKKYDVWMPPGGHCENNEETWHCAERELFEETGISIKLPINRISDTVMSIPCPFAIQKEELTVDHYHRDYLYFARIDRFCGDIRVVTEENLPYKWFTFEEAMQSGDMWDDVRTHSLAILSGVIR